MVWKCKECQFTNPDHRSTCAMCASHKGGSGENVPALSVSTTVGMKKVLTPQQRAERAFAEEMKNLDKQFKMDPNTKNLSSPVEDDDETVLQRVASLGRTRYRVYVTTDKSVYRASEVVYITATILSVSSNAPDPNAEGEVTGDVTKPRLLPAKLIPTALVTIKSAKGVVLTSLTVNVEGSVAAFAYTVPPSTAAGEYVVEVSVPQQTNASVLVGPGKRKIDVWQFSEPPRLRKQLQFVRKGLGLGDKAVATLSVKRAEGGVPKGAKVLAVARVDGKEIYRSDEYNLDSDGVATICFTLPEQMTDGDGTVTCTIHDGGTVENASKTIPILLNKIDVRFYPEGGHLVAGLPNKLYLEAFLKTGEPADLDADIIVDDSSSSASSSSATPLAEQSFEDILGLSASQPQNVVCAVETFHEGRGICSFTPEAGKRYALVVYKPKGIVAPIPVGDGSTYKASGAVFSPVKAAFQPADAMEFTLAATEPGNYRLSVFKEDQELSSAIVQVEAAGMQQKVTLAPASSAGDGVLRVTLFNAVNRPIAERLVFRYPTGKIKVVAATTRSQYAPGDRVGLRFQTLDEHDRPVPAWVSITVTDDSALQMVEKRKEQPRLREMALIEGSVRAPLRDSTAYIADDDSDRPSKERSETSLDLLLGTQGWRRFIWHQSPNKKVGEKELYDVTRVLGIPDAPNRLQTIVAPLAPSNPQVSPVSQGLSRPTWRLQAQDLLSSVGSNNSNNNNNNNSSRNRLKDKRKKKGGMKLFKFGREKKEVEEEELSEGKAERVSKMAAPPQRRGSGPGRGGARGGRGGAPPGRVFGAPMAQQAPRGGGGPPPPAPSSTSSSFSTSSSISVSTSLSVAAAPMALPPGGYENSYEALRLDGSDDDDDIESSSSEEDAYVERRRKSRRRPSGRGRGYHAGRRPNRAITRKMSPRSRPPIAATSVTGQTVVREYSKPAPAKQPGSGPRERSDFTSTVYWAGAKHTDANGLGDANFHLCDSITTFRIRIDAFRTHNQLGGGTSSFESVQPFSVEPKVPIEVSTGDMIIFPVTAINRTFSDVKATITTTGGTGLAVGAVGADAPPGTAYNQSSSISAGKRERFFVQAAVGPSPCTTRLQLAAAIQGNDDTKGDTISKNIKVVGRGFPVTHSAAGNLGGAETSAGHEFTVASDRIKEAGTRTTAEVHVAPSSNMLSSLKGLIKTPHGCFEQLAATMYPMSMVLTYLNTAGIGDPSTLSDLTSKISAGYKRMVAYRSRDRKGGFEWWGSNPGHEALTAFGILILLELSLVWDGVETKVLKAAVRWLLSRRDGRGRFEQGRGMYAFARPERTSADAYILWALTEAGARDVKAELDFLVQYYRMGKKGTSTDSYVLSLLVIALNNVGRHDEALEVAKSLAVRTTNNGLVREAKNTITRSGATSRDVETASLAIIGWCRVDKVQFSDKIDAALGFVQSKRSRGMYGSTQGTALALKAIMVHQFTVLGGFSSSSASSSGAPAVALMLGDEVLHRVTYTNQRTIKFPQFGKHVQSGQTHTVSVVAENMTQRISYNVDVKYKVVKPASDESCAVHLTQKLNNMRLGEGEGSEVEVSITNRTANPLPMVLAVISLPGGLEPRREKLKELVAAKTINHFDVQGRAVNIYLNGMHESSTVSFAIDVIGAIPGVYAGAASYACLYYTPAIKHWVEELIVNVTPSTNSVAAAASSS